MNLFHEAHRPLTLPSPPMGARVMAREEGRVPCSPAIASGCAAARARGATLLRTVRKWRQAGRLSYVIKTAARPYHIFFHERFPKNDL
jgi:hypothetical protein